VSTKIKAIEATADAVTSTVDAAAAETHKAAASAAESMGQAVAGLEKTQVKFKEGMEKAMKTAEEMMSFSQGNIDAVMKSSQIWAAGIQDLSKQWAATAQTAMGETMTTIKAMSSVKSLKEAIDLQTSLARSSMEKVMAESGKFTDASVKLAEQTMAPLAARVTLAVETFSKTAV
jgi:phasin family protein